MSNSCRISSSSNIVYQDYLLNNSTFGTYLPFIQSLLPLFIAYGAYTAFTSGAERAFIVEHSPSGLKGTILGLYGMLQGIGLLLSSIIAGLLWENINSSAPFLFGGTIGILSALIISVILGKNNLMKLFGKAA